MEKFTFSKALEEATVLKKTQVPEETIEPLKRHWYQTIKKSLYSTREMWNIKEKVIDDIFTYTVATEISKDNTIIIMIQNHVQYMNIDKGNIGQK